MTEAMGRKVKEMEMKNVKPFVNTSGLPKGIYQIRVESESQSSIQKWVQE